MFYEILRGAEGRFADGWRRFGEWLLENHAAIDKIADEQRREAEKLAESAREWREEFNANLDQISDELDSAARDFEQKTQETDAMFANIRDEYEKDMRFEGAETDEIPKKEKNNRKGGIHGEKQ